MKTKNLKTICIAAVVALFLSVNVQAQDKMAKDTSKKMSKMEHKKMAKKKMSKMSGDKMKKDSTKM
jgi:pentapeptide MXKDX repeat protein